MRLVVYMSSLALLGAPPARALAQHAEAVRTNGEVPVIDGRLDESVWTTAAPITGFLQRNPIEGATPSESTEVRFLYTDRDLYVGFRGYDRTPGGVYGRLVRRDQRAASDHFSLFIDSFFDRRTAYEFTINPTGARRDVFIYDDGGGRDDSWDPVYDWATQVDSLGWTVELRIPFSQLRFSGRDSVVFGLRLRRGINRRNEEMNWPFFPRDQAGEVSRYARLVGLRDLPSPRRIEVLPYTAGSAAFEPAEAGNPFVTGERSSVRTGADLKVGVTSGLTLDLTVNPDFGQVEADPAVVNLSAFETFFPEKRPFFIEGTNLFQFGLQPSRRGEFGGGRGGEEDLVYTRRIGRAPQVDPDDGGGYAESVEQTTILSAAKLSGQIGGGWQMGLAQAVTAKERADVLDGLGNRGSAPVEPLTSVTVVRALRSVRGGRLAYGAIATGLVRDLDESVFEELHERAFTGGLDLSARFGRDTYVLDVAVTGSRVEGGAEALVLTQRRSAHYFQRPDQDHLDLDSSRTALSGFAGYARLAKAVGFLTWDLRYATRSPGFEINDLGFLRRADLHEQRAEVELRWLQPGTVFREFELQFQEQLAFTYGGERTRTSVEASANGDFLNYWNLSLGIERRFEALNTRLLRGGPAFLEPGGWDLRVSGRTNFRKQLSGNARVSHSRDDVGGNRSWRFNAAVRVRPPGGFAFSLDGGADRETDDRQYVTQETVADSTYYVLGRLDRREVSLTLRADLALSPRLSLELYAQPFVSVGRYETLKLAANTRAAAHGARTDVLGADRLTRPGGDADVLVDVDRDGTNDFSFEEPDFRVVSIRTNTVLRWEFRPGSSLFLVYQQNRRDRTNDANFRIPAALGDAFGASGSHVFAVKIAYWLGL